MTDIFREIDEEVRRDKAAEFWAKYQNWIIGLALLVVLASGGWRYWQYQRRVAAEAAGAQFEKAVQLERDGKAKEAQAAFAEVAKGSAAGYAMLARMRAATAAAASDPAAAIKAFEAISADQAIDPLFRDAARLRAAMLQVDQNTAYEEVQKSLAPLAAPTGTYRHTARELLALAAMRSNDFAAAAKWLDLIMADASAPSNLRQRAVLMQSLVGSGPPPGANPPSGAK